MKRPVRGKDGFYVIDDIKYPNLFGSREQVSRTGPTSPLR